MIKDIFILKDSQVHFLDDQKYIAVGSDNYAAINICNPKAVNGMEIYPSHFSEYLFLTFSEYTPKFYDSKDQVLREKELKAIKENNIILPTDSDAKKILIYCDAVHAKPGNYSLYINSELGRSAASIGKFLGAWEKLPIHGFNENNPNNDNAFLSALLAYAFGEIWKERKELAR